MNTGNDPESVDYGRLYHERYSLLRMAYERSGDAKTSEFQSFASKNVWLDDYALFMALKDKFGGASFSQWQDDIRLRKKSEVEKYRNELAFDIEFYKFIQYHFFSQWNELKKYANGSGIKIIGDIPIYVAADSADTWAEPQLFQLDSDNIPTAVAGCPPDGFAADGQLWGNPLYNWEMHRRTQYKWWIKRMRHCFELYDVVRIDHFRGFDEYYSIPYGSENAKNGHWEKGPGIELFRAIEQSLGKKQVIAEDLGFVTDSVRKLVKDSGFPNMRVLEFAFDSRDTGSSSEYLPHNYPENCAAYTGTHDNQTITSWYQTISDHEQSMVREYLCDNFTPDNKLYKSLIALIMRSNASLSIIPMQDWLGLDDNSRMNTPSTLGNNWKWRMKRTDMSDELGKEICTMTKIYGRISNTKKV